MCKECAYHNMKLSKNPSDLHFTPKGNIFVDIIFRFVSFIIKHHTSPIFGMWSSNMLYHISYPPYKNDTKENLEKCIVFFMAVTF